VHGSVSPTGPKRAPTSSMPITLRERIERTRATRCEHMETRILPKDQLELPHLIATGANTQPLPHLAHASTPNTPISAHSDPHLPPRRCHKIRATALTLRAESYRSISLENEREYVDPAAHHLDTMTYNVGRSYDTTIALFDDDDILNFNVVNIQKPWLNVTQARSGTITTYRGPNQTLTEPLETTWSARSRISINASTTKPHGEQCTPPPTLSGSASRLAPTSSTWSTIYEAHTFDRSMAIQWQTSR
jgi:hypothetical protein